MAKVKELTQDEAKAASVAMPVETAPLVYLETQCKTCGAIPTFTQGGRPDFKAVCGMCGKVTERAG